MSYILDALRRADSEREQGAVPSLHSKQVPPALADADEVEAGRGVTTFGWVAMGASALIGAALVWFFTGRSEAPADVPVPATVVQAPVMPAPGAASFRQPEPAAPVSTAAVPTPAPTRIAAAPTAPPALSRLAEPRATVKPAPSKPPAPAAVDESTPVPSASDLPDDIRRQLPTLSVSGATYSKTASSRMLILNGQVFHEGDKVTNELTLEQIRLKSAVLSFRGTRYSISY